MQPPWEPGPGDGAVTIVLVRHGQTAWNVSRRFLGTTDLPLDEMGLAQARELADWLPEPFDRVYTSPLLRAAQTARHLDSHPVEVPAVQEMHQGLLEGLHGHEGMQRFPDFFAAFGEDPEQATVPGGESLGGCRDRAIAALERIADGAAPGARVAVVTHQMVIASVTCSVHGKPLTRWREHAIHNGALTVLHRADQRWVPGVEDWRVQIGAGRDTRHV